MMNETDPIEFDLEKFAKMISKNYYGAPVVIVMGGTGEITDKGKLNRVMTGSWCEKAAQGKEDYRFYDFAGILQSAIVYTAIKHCPWLIDESLALRAKNLKNKDKVLLHHEKE